MDPPTEEENPDYFTVNQLRMIVSEFKHIFPSGSVPFRSFIDTFKLLVSRSVSLVQCTYVPTYVCTYVCIVYVYHRYCGFTNKPSKLCV